MEEFREKWKEELKNVTNSSSHGTTDSETSCNTDENLSDNERARILFGQGIDAERRGLVFEAMRLYRRAVQLVPDIEFKMYETSIIQNKNNNTKTPDDPSQSDNNESKSSDEPYDENNENLDGIDLILRFKLALQKSDRMISSSLDKSVITSGSVHFSDLPTEIILYILRWVVSSDLDVRSLENCASVCKGLYLCARDSEIWRQACVKIWGANMETLKVSEYLSWRQMFYERTRVHFHGCYISKTSYLRYGENSFQDQFYRPVQLVEYYRYFRFFPDGQVLVMTTADEPAQSVGKLKRKYVTRSDIIKGQYRLHKTGVVIVLKKTKTQHRYDYVNRNRQNVYEEPVTDTYYIEFNILSGKRKFCQLEWKHYSIIQMKKNTEMTTDFELTSVRYPSLWFSPVKSYNSDAEAPLQ